MRRFDLVLLCIFLTLCCITTVTVEAGSHKTTHDDIKSKSSASPPGPGGHTLITVQVVSRHGTRAPNPVVAEICPADRANLARYGDLRLTLAGLTGTGQKELYALGVFTRQTYMERSYPHFLSSYFNDEEIYFRAVGEDRTIQSAVCMGQGMYPKGTAAIGYFTDLPSPVPIYTLPDEMDSLLEVRKKDCAPQLKKDAALWDQVEGIKLYQENEGLIQRMLDMCNITDLNEAIVGTGDNYGDAIKDITDAWTFDMIEGFPPQEGLNYTSLLEFRTMAVKQLLGRIIGTEEQITYMNGQLPERMVNNFETAIANQGPNPASTHQLKMYAYHGHREMMYALGAFLGIEYDIKFPGLPKGAIPPATTLFFELHYIGERVNGSIPDPWESNGMLNPYLHRMVLPQDMPKLRKWGAPVGQPWQPTQEEEQLAKDAPPPSQTEQVQQPHPSELQQQAQAEQEKQQHPAQWSAPDAPQPSPSTSDSHHHHRKLLADPPHSRTGENELNGVKPEDRPSKLERGIETPKKQEQKHDIDRHGQREHQQPDQQEGNVSHGPSDSETPKHSILPHSGHVAPGNGLVKIPDTHMPAPPSKGYVVRAFLWHPCGDESITEEEPKHHPKHTADCPAVPVIMSAVCDDYECSMDDFADKLEARVRKTGTWDELCHVSGERLGKVTADVEAARQELTAESMVGASTTATPPQSHAFRWIVIIGCCVLLYAALTKYRAHMVSNRREEYITFSQAEMDETAPLQRIY